MQNLTLQTRNGYAIVTLNRGRSNAINFELVEEMREMLKNIASDDQIGGLVLTGKEGFFSAGLDVIELYQYDEPQMEKFWRSFLSMIGELVAFEKPMVAAITGHSPAGGCLMALAADFRFMAAGKYRIGLNEVPVGIAIPYGVFALYAFWLGKRQAYQAMLEGKLFTADEAKTIGLVDEALPLETVLPAAEEKMQSLLYFAPNVWQTSKKALRSELLTQMQKTDESVLRSTLDIWWSPQSRFVMGQLVESLVKK